MYGRFDVGGDNTFLKRQKYREDVTIITAIVIIKNEKLVFGLTENCE